MSRFDLRIFCFQRAELAVTDKGWMFSQLIEHKLQKYPNSADLGSNLKEPRVTNLPLPADAASL